jgi:hypothetical protein
MSEGRISSFIDQSSIKKEGDYFKGILADIYNQYIKIKETKITLEGSKTFTEAAQNVSVLKKTTDELTGSVVKAATSLQKQQDAYTILIAQQKDAEATAKRLAAQYGVESDQAIKAANAAVKLKEQLTAINDLSKSGGITFEQRLAQQLQNIRTQGAESVPGTTEASPVNVASNGTKEEKENVDALTLAIKEYQKQTDALATTQAKRNASDSETNKQLIQEKIALQQRNQEIKNTVIADSAAEGSIDQLKAKLSLLQKQYDALSATERDASAGQQLIKNIQATDAQLKQLEFDTGRFQRNVGNYAGTFSSAFNVLKEDLTNIQSQLSQMNEGDVGFSSLTKRASFLEEVLGGVTQQFSSTRQELRAFQEAAVKLGVNLGLTDEEFQKFNAAVGQAKNEIDDIKKATNVQASDTKGLDGLISAAQGLAGAYGIAQGAAQLFGDDNEDLQKTFVKLQAAMTVIQGLQAIQNALQKESAATQLILTVREKALSAIQVLRNFVLTGSVTATKAQTTAIITNAAAETSNSEATVVNTVTTEAQTGAMVATAAATKGASAAMITLRSALIATGIGAILVLLASTAAAMSNLGEATKEMTKKNEELIDSTKELNDNLIQQVEAANNADQAFKRFFENQLSLSQSYGQNQLQQFAIRKQLIAEEKRLAQDQIDDLGATNKQQATLLTQIQEAERKQAFYLQHYQQAITQGNDRAADAAKTLAELASKELQSVQSKYDAGEKARQDLFTSTQQQAQLELEQQKFSADEQRQLTLETTKLKLQAVIDSNNRILSNEKSTEAEKIAAQKSNLQQEIAIIEAEKKAKLSDPSLTPTQRAITIKDAGAAEQKATIDNKVAIQKINDDYYKRDLAAQYQYLQIKISQDAKYNEGLSNNQNLPLENRLKAYQKYVDDEKALINADFEYQKKTKVLTDDELKTLEADKDTKLVQLAADAHKKITDIITQSFEKQREESQRTQEQFEQFIQSLYVSDVDRSQDYAADVQALNKSLQQKKISVQEYEVQKNAIEKQYETESVVAQIEKIQRLIDYKKSIGDDTKQDEINLANLQIEMSNKVTDAKIQNLNKLHDLEKELADQSINLIQSIVDGSYDKQKNAIQDQIDLLEKKKAKDIEVASATIANEQDKAAAIATINAKADAQKQLLEIKQRQIDQRKAQFDKVIQGVKIAATTIQGESQLDTEAAIAQAQAARAQADAIRLAAEALANPALAPAAGAMQAAAGALQATVGIIAGEKGVLAGIGAAQIAALFAIPVPKYRHGVFDSPANHGPGTFAVVGDGGVPEVIQHPDGKTFVSPSHDTLTYLPEHSRVYPSVENYEKTMVAFASKPIAIPTIHQEDHMQQFMTRMDKRLLSVENTIKNKRENHYHVTPYGLMAMQKDMNSQIDYINDQSNW